MQAYPIDTAPKNGTRFLVKLKSGHVSIGFYMTPNCFCADTLGSGNTEPESWMPLPDFEVKK